MMRCVPDALFADPRLALLYDVIDDDRSDLDAYVAIATELGATSVLDVGCGTEHSPAVPPMWSLPMATLGSGSSWSTPTPTTREAGLKVSPGE